jgi:hypothetical protein
LADLKKAGLNTSLLPGRKKNKKKAHSEEQAMDVSF